MYKYLISKLKKKYNNNTPTFSTQYQGKNLVLHFKVSHFRDNVSAKSDWHNLYSPRIPDSVVAAGFCPHNPHQSWFQKQRHRLDQVAFLF